MRRALLPTLVLLSFALAPLAAQRRTFERIRHYFDGSDALEIGLVGGPNRNTVTGAGPVDPKIRGLLGGYLSVPIAGGLRLRPEVLVSGKLVGFPNEILVPPCLPPGGCLPISGQETASFTWLEAPILLETRFHRALGGWGTPRIYGGPFVAVRLACSFSTPASAQPAPLNGTVPQLVQSCNAADGSSTRYNNGDAGFVIGGAISTGGIGLGFRWTRSLVPIAPDQSVLTGSRLIGAKNSTLAVTLEIGTRLR
ncbi:MAG: hypothetical protein ABI647_17830 [Gemmatimonadota bacterium]